MPVATVGTLEEAFRAIDAEGAGRGAIVRDLYDQAREPPQGRSSGRISVALRRASVKFAAGGKRGP